MEFPKAKKLALSYINKKYKKKEIEVVLVDKQTITTPIGWVFFYNTKEFLEDKSTNNGFFIIEPLLIDKFEEKLVILKNREKRFAPLEVLLEDYRFKKGYPTIEQKDYEKIINYICNRSQYAGYGIWKDNFHLETFNELIRVINILSEKVEKEGNLKKEVVANLFDTYNDFREKIKNSSDLKLSLKLKELDTLFKNAIEALFWSGIKHNNPVTGEVWCGRRKIN